MPKWWCCPVHLNLAIRHYVNEVCQATNNSITNDTLLDFLMASRKNPVFYFPDTQEKKAYTVFIRVTVREVPSHPERPKSRFFAAVGTAENEIKEDGTNEDGTTELYYEIDEEAWKDRNKTVGFEDDDEVWSSVLSFDMCPLQHQRRRVHVEAIWAIDEDEQNDESR